MSEKLEIIISAKDKNTSRTLKKISVDMGKLGDATEKTAKQSKKAAASTKDLGKSFKGLSTSLMAGVGGIVAAGFALKKVFDFGKEGAGMMRLQDAGESLAASFGTSMDTIVDAVREASFSTISDMDIIAAANKAMMLGVATDAKTMASLMQVAMARGRAMGLSTAQAFNDIVTGIGRASPMILDNLGIVLDAESTYSKYATSIGKAASELTKAEKVSALTYATIKEGSKLIDDQGGIALDTAGKIEAMEAAFKNLGDTFKMNVAPGVATAAEAVLEFVELMAAMGDHTVAVDKAFKDGAITQEQYAKMSFTTAISFTELAEKSQLLEDHLYGLAQAQGYAVMSMTAGEQALRQMGIAQLDWTKYLEGGTEAGWNAVKVTESLHAGYYNIASSLDQAKSSVVGYDAAIRAASSAGELLAGANRSISSSISNLRQDIEWLQKGGLELQMQFEQVKTAVLANAITPEEAKGMLDNLFIQAQALEIDMGDLDFKGAAGAISKELEIPLEDAEKALSDFQTGVDDLDIEQPFKDALAPTDELRKAFGLMGDSVEELTDLEVAAYMEGWGSAIDTSLNPSLDTAKTIVGELATNLNTLPDSKDIYVTVHYGDSGDLVGPGGQHGLDMVVPPGFPNDTFPIRASSGEHVKITPHGQAQNVSYGGAEVNVNVNTGPISSDIDIEDLAWTLARRIQEGV